MTQNKHRPYCCGNCGVKHQSPRGLCGVCQRFAGLSDDGLQDRINWHKMELAHAENEALLRYEAEKHGNDEPTTKPITKGPF